MRAAMNGQSASPMRSNIWKLYAIQALTQALFAIPIIVLFWQSHGLTLQQNLLLQSGFALMVLSTIREAGWFPFCVFRFVSCRDCRSWGLCGEVCFDSRETYRRQIITHGCGTRSGMWLPRARPSSIIMASIHVPRQSYCLGLSQSTHCGYGQSHDNF